ncbi:beta-ketoacyl-ACP synthase II [Rhabdochlamydiaceae symbiont of Dictyostelium giganteum]|uniref:beta-ketoacyl-ACP synthase II n=1 Tax=Rhabdochlamydiaceae symbiont of Dictyostelium giganteum TaxID=3342349 RepID=UPI00384D758A
MKKKRVVITGMGIVSCFGTDVDHFYQQLLEGKSGITPITEFPCENYPTRFAGSVKDFDIGNYLDKKQARRVDPFVRYTVVAGKKALEHSNLSEDKLSTLNKLRCGVIIGSGMGGMKTFYEGVETLLQSGHKRLSPFFVPYIITNMGGAMLAMDLGFQGPNYSVSTACATANYCIVSAAEHIQRGDADLMVCGGAEASLNPIGVAGFVACKALSERNDDFQKASRPWDKSRDGFVIGEGAGVLVLESLEHALARGAPILAEYLGGSVNCDAYHITSPREDGSGVSECIRLAVQDAGIEKEQINYVNAHATSTLAGDVCEITGIKHYFGDHAKQLSINSTKSMTGHCLGAAGGIEAIATIKAIQTNLLHPTINLDDPEEIIQDLDCVPNHKKEKVVTAALSNSFGFGGHNSAIILAPFQK